MPLQDSDGFQLLLELTGDPKQVARIWDKATHDVGQPPSGRCPVVVASRYLRLEGADRWWPAETSFRNNGLTQSYRSLLEGRPRAEVLVWLLRYGWGYGMDLTIKVSGLEESSVVEHSLAHLEAVWGELKDHGDRRPRQEFEQWSSLRSLSARQLDSVFRYLRSELSEDAQSAFETALADPLQRTELCELTACDHIIQLLAPECCSDACALAVESLARQALRGEGDIDDTVAEVTATLVHRFEELRPSESIVGFVSLTARRHRLRKRAQEKAAQSKLTNDVGPAWFQKRIDDAERQKWREAIERALRRLSPDELTLYKARNEGVKQDFAEMGRHLGSTTRAFRLYAKMIERLRELVLEELGE